MNFREIGEKVLAGQLEFDTCGHRCHPIKERFIEGFQRLLEGEHGDMDGKWQNREGEDEEEINKRMREYFRNGLEFEIEKNGPLAFLSEQEYYCFTCGRNMKLTFDGEKLALKRYFDRELGDFALASCSSKEKPYGGEIEITSKLVFANFFRLPDSPPELKWNDEWSLNCYDGRVRICHYKATNQNVACGQLGNMSVGIYVHPNKKSIIVGDPYVADRRAEELSDKEYKKLTKADWAKMQQIGGHKLKGTVCLDVWRWEAGDKEKLGEAYQEIVNEDKDIVEVTVPKGIWKFTTFYRCDDEEDNDSIYAKLELKGEK